MAATAAIVLAGAGCSSSGGAPDGGNAVNGDSGAGSDSGAGDAGEAGDSSADPGPSTTACPTGALPTLTLTGGNQPVKVPFKTWTGARVAVAPSTTGATYYVDAAAGKDSNAGTSLAAALKSIGAAVKKVAPGDTVLIKGGLYREVVDLSNVSGKVGLPITFGAYGDGEVIVDGSAAVTGWTRTQGSSTVWQAPVTGGAHVDAVVVNDVPLVKYKTTTAIPAAASGQWYFDGASTLYADMGNADPNSPTTDVLVVANNHGASTIFLGASSYLNVIGLTIRGSGWAGIWSYPASAGVGGDHVTVAYCDIEFNDGDGLGFGGGSNDASLYNHVYHNSLTNWPFGANGYASAGGGWPGGLGFSYEANPTVCGNVVSMNGGEGIILYGNGTSNGLHSGNSLIQQNVSYDNWSVNLYLDNQPTHVVRQNLLFRHRPTPAWMWDPSDVYTMEKFRVCLGLGDEYASGNPAGTASLAHVQAYDNLLIGCRYGISDGAEDTTGHGMKDDLIVNNTIVMDDWTYTQEFIAGITIGNDGTNSTNTLIANNIVYRPKTCSSTSPLCPLIGTAGSTALSGITLGNNLYDDPGVAGSDASLFATNTATAAKLVDFAGWQAFEGTDKNSIYQDPQFVGPANLEPPSSGTFDYTQAALAAASPARGLAVPQTSIFTVDFAGAPRGASWTAGALQ